LESTAAVLVVVAIVVTVLFISPKRIVESSRHPKNKVAVVDAMRCDAMLSNTMIGKDGTKYFYVINQ